MPRFAANLSMMFTEVPFLKRFEAAAQAGFTAVEYLFPYAYSMRELAACLADCGLEQVLFNGPPGDFVHAGERGLAALPGREAEFIQGLSLALEYANALHCPQIHIMAGLTHQGANRLTFVRNMRHAARLAAVCNVQLLIEPINTRDIPGYLINRTSEALALITLIGEPNVGLQFDIYHRQIMEGDLLAAIDEFGAYAAHVQIAQPPDRGEPDDGEIDYRRVFSALDAVGYVGWIGCEYKPRGDTVAGLSWLTTLLHP